MIHLLLLSQEGRWARDPDGNQWVLRGPTANGTNFCTLCVGAIRIPDDEPRWVSRLPGGAGMYRPPDRVVCQQHADVQHPITGRAPA